MDGEAIREITVAMEAAAEAWLRLCRYKGIQAFKADIPYEILAKAALAEARKQLDPNKHLYIGDPWAPMIGVD